MRSYSKCEICNEWHWDSKKCLPEYLVYHEDYLGDESKTVRASSHENAAIKYAEYYNQDDYPLMNDIIEIRVEKDGIVKFFKVGAEPDVHYYSEEIES